MANIVGSVTSGETLLLTTDGSIFKQNEYILLDNEFIKILSISGNYLTASRGQLNTNAASHGSSLEVYPFLVTKARPERDRNEKWINRKVEFETGAEQIQGVTVNPIITWNLTYSGDKDGYNELKTFFNNRNGSRKIFHWKDEAGIRHKVRFVNDDMTFKQKLTPAGLVAFETSATLKKVY